MATPDSLTLENFWNGLEKAYPTEMKLFCVWIDRYKKRIQWNNLFYGGLKNRLPKFHNLPIAMQLGIFYQFMCEQSAKDGEVGLGYSMEAGVKEIEMWFKLQRMPNEQKQEQ